MSRAHPAARSGLYRGAPHALPAAKRSCKVSAAGWLAALLGMCTALYVLYPSGGPHQQPAVLSTDVMETRRLQRIEHGRVLRQYVKGGARQCFRIPLSWGGCPGNGLWLGLCVPRSPQGFSGMV